MNLAEIKSAVDQGKKVFWSTSAYRVIKDKIGQYLIGYNIGGHGENYIGLTWQDGTTLNGKESEFYALNYRIKANQKDIIASTLQEGWKMLGLPVDFLPKVEELEDYGDETVVFLEKPVVNGYNFAVITETKKPVQGLVQPFNKFGRF